MEKFYPTKAGIEYAALTAQGKIIEFTKGKFGDGVRSTENITELTDLIHPLGELPISKKSVKNSTIITTTQFSNRVGGSILPTFYLMEIGLFAKVVNADGTDDDEHPETLIGYAFDGHGDKIIGTSLSEFIINIPLTVADVNNVTVDIDSLVYPTLKQFEDEVNTRKTEDEELQNSLNVHITDTSNPHGVTAEQIGLDKVPNVATNDQTPTYSQNSSLSNITSGEKLSVSFGKIMKAIADLISHIGSKSNPHSVTKSQVGLDNVPNVATNDQQPTFAESGTRSNIVSGETLSTLFGKIKKFFADLKTVAFTGSYTDLSNKPTSMQNPNSLTLTMNGSATNYNGSATASKSWYAPTSGGTAGYNLISNGSGAPVWKMPDNYAECTTSGETTVKSVSIYNFVLTKGVRVRIKFSYPHISLSKPAKLNVNGSGEKLIKYYGRDVYGYMGKPFTSSAHTGFFANTWEANDIVEFEYDGTYWVSIPSKHLFDPSDIRIAHTDYIQWSTSGETWYMGMYCNHIASNADYITERDDIDVILQDAVNRVIGGGKIQLIGGRADDIFVVNTGIFIGHKTGSMATSTFDGVDTFIIEGKSRNSHRDIRPTLRFKALGCLDGIDNKATSKGMTLTIKDVILSKLGTERITLINLGKDNGSTLILENVSLHITSTIPDELFIAENIILKNCDFTIEATQTNIVYPCSSGLWCKNIQISGGSITLVNNVSGEFVNQSYELNFLYNSEAKGHIEKCKINCSGNYRTNISNGEITFDKCDITLNNKAALCHYTTDTERKYSILRDCTINYTATTYLTFGKVIDCTFINSSSGYTTDSYKLQILCPTQMIGNLFVGRSEMNFNNYKVQFIGNAMQYSQSYTSFPTGSVNIGTMITG